MKKRAVVVVLAGLFALMAAGVAGAVPASGPEIDDALAVFSGVMSGTTPGPCVKPAEDGQSIVTNASTLIGGMLGSSSGNDFSLTGNLKMKLTNVTNTGTNEGLSQGMFNLTYSSDHNHRLAGKVLMPFTTDAGSGITSWRGMITASYQHISPTGWLNTGDQLVANVQMQSNNAGQLDGGFGVSDSSLLSFGPNSDVSITTTSKC
jgi:hypothetical protein